MTTYSIPVTTVTRTDMYGNDITLSIKGHPGNFHEPEELIASIAELIGPVIAAHAFPNVTRTEVADALVPYSEQYDEIRDKQRELQTAVESMQSSVHAARVEDAYRENAVRDYLDEQMLDWKVRDEIVRLMTVKQPDLIPPAA
jgi:hypothetical protein